MRRESMYIADLHIHSHYSRATSRECTPAALDMWARRKGIHITGTGDFTHPGWRKELNESLKPVEDGLYVLKEDQAVRDDVTPDLFMPRFVVTGEISSIYKKNGRVRKVHSLIILPDLKLLKGYPQSWKRQETSTLTEGRYWEWTAEIWRN